jgi:heme-degrading monooxygenase HmoA
MGAVYTTGSWKPSQGREDDFVAAWEEFAGWASGRLGAGRLRLTRDLFEEGRYVSFGEWTSLEEVHAWKASPEFKERMAQVLQHVDEFKPAELEEIALAESGAVTALRV